MTTRSFGHYFLPGP